MSRSTLIAALLLAATPLAAQASDRYGPRDSDLRPAPPVLSERGLLTWASKEARLRQPAPRTAPATPQSARPALRGAAPPVPARPDHLADLRPARAPPPNSIYDTAVPTGSITAEPPLSHGAYQPNAQARPTYSPQGPVLRPRAYSVGREWGVQPDPIAMPDPSVLAYAPEMGAAILAQQERENEGAPAFNPASPADLDMLERQQQDADREALRDKTRAENRAKALK